MTTNEQRTGRRKQPVPTEPPYANEADSMQAEPTDRQALIPRGRLAARAAALAAVAALMATASADAQVRMTAPPQDGPVALTGGTLHTVTDGVIEDGTIVFDDGVITDVGPDATIPAGAEEVDVTGMHVWPGLIDGYSQMGIYEIGAVGVTTDLGEVGDFNPNARPEVAVNPESRHIGTARTNGVLVTLTTPMGGRVSGLSSALQMEGWTWEEMTLLSGAALNVNWPSPGDDGEYEEAIAEIREIFATARAYRDAVESGQRHDTDSRWEAMIPAVEGDIPVVVSANEIRQMQDAIQWAEDEGIDLVLRGGRDALYVADQLVEKDIPLLLGSVITSPGRGWKSYDEQYKVPAQLHEKGVRFAIAAGASAPYANRLPYEAGAAVAFGLPEEVALEALTLRPAEFFGIDERLGSLEAGKDATLVITDGHLLDYLGSVEQAYIEGRKIDMTDIHRHFYDKYREKVQQRRTLQMGN